MKTVVDYSKLTYEESVINKSFYQFSKNMGFRFWTYKVFRPQTKWKVENLTKITERLRAFNYEFDSLDDLDNIVKSLNKDLNN